MNVRNIGYTDSYGGLISAIEARALTEKGKEDIKLARRDYLLEMIRDSTSQGVDHLVLDLSKDEPHIFRGLGYTIEPIANKHQDNLYKVSWKDSPSSETTNNSDKENISSSGEVVASLPIATEVAPSETL